MNLHDRLQEWLRGQVITPQERAEAAGKGGVEFYGITILSFAQECINLIRYGRERKAL